MKSLLTKQRQKLTKTLALLKKKRVPPASLETYPVDILNAIADKLSLKDFRSLRLVTKAISLATILLFTRKYLHYLKIDFTEEGLQRAIDITSHYDVSGTLCFGPRINTITFDLTHFVWKSEEEGVWLEAITRTRDPIHWRTLKKRSRKAARQWRSHQKLIGGLYAQMLEGIFRQVEGVTVEIIGERRDNDYDYEGMVMFRSRGRFRRSGLNGYEPSEPEKNMASNDVNILRYGTDSVISMDCLTFFILEIFAALRRSNTQLLGFTTMPSVAYNAKAYFLLERLARVVEQHETLPGHLISWSFLQSCAALDISVSNVLDKERSVEDQQVAARFFKAAAQSLTSLTLRGHRHIQDMALGTVVTALVQHVHFSKLRHLHFDFGNIQDQSLVAFIDKHSCTLKTFELTILCTNFGKWPSVLHHLSNLEFPKLENLSFSGLRERYISPLDNRGFWLSPHQLMKWVTLPDLGASELTCSEIGVQRFSGNSVDKFKWIAATIRQDPDTES
ncbi:hypothetical protein BLS_008212 [Venturia inaequalis]|uniref:F-box domain-containing protein n=1 Tax=Venturia inaequalis TaxID=5025 RepID=A0A8H3U7Q3_VENIN|nr:hypothetical protein EG328_010730 [Venturia inaequalis]KAE9964590.1 hypothetical protein BLS_008212 [Venturia inaequalis]